MGAAVAPRTGSRGSLVALVLGVFAVVSALIVGMFAAQLVSVVNQRNNSTLSRRATNLLNATTAAELSVLGMENALRGYLLTKDRRVLAPLTRARVELPAQLTKLRKLAASPADVAQVTAITGYVSSYLTDFANPLIASGGRLSATERGLQTEQGALLLDQASTRLTAFGTREQAIVTKRRARSTDSSSRTLTIAIVGLAASLVVLAILAAYLLVSVLRPIRGVAGAAQRLSRGDLKARVRETGLGEVQQLATSFNAMAEALGQRELELSIKNQELASALDAAEQASRMKSRFLANMSHEIRTPLHGVIGMLSLLEATHLQADQREYVRTATTSGEALMGVINDILDLSKIEAGQLTIDRHEFDLHEAIETACELTASAAHEKGVNLQAFIDRDVPRYVRSDRLRLSQILTNLLSNAVKFTNSGEILVLARTADDGSDTPTVRVEVRDTGIGIAPERLPQLFDAFVQADDSTTRRFGGTGLGLAISRQLAHLMSGSLDAISEPGKGSSFTLSVPVESSNGHSVAYPLQFELQGLRVLVVDDKETNRTILHSYVTTWGLRATTASDANAAMSLLQDAAASGEPFELALLDSDMPQESGLQLARRIYETPSLRTTRLIMLTSHGADDDHIAVPGIQALLTKPTRQSHLLETITRVMNSAPVVGDVAPVPERAPGPSPTPSGRRILVADDQHVNRLFLDEALARQGHVSDPAVDGEEVLAMLDRAEYDLILMDCQMPNLDGYETTRAIRRGEEEEGAGRHIPIVAMTALAMQGDRERCLAAGMDDYLAKPIRVDDVHKTLQRWLEPEHQAAPAVLDPARLRELRATLGAQRLHAIFTSLLETAPAMVEELDQALADGDANSTQTISHRLRGNALTVGALDLAQVAGDINTLARADEIDQAQGHRERLRSEWEETMRAAEQVTGGGDA